MPRLLLFLPLLLFGVLSFFLWKGLSLDPKELPSALIGKPFPNFEMASLQDPEHLLTNADVSGHHFLVNVWATWCPACKQEHPELLAITEEQGINIIGLNYKDDRDSAKEWLKQLGNPYLFNIFDENGSLGLDLGVYGAPETYLVDAKGIVKFRHVGAITPQVWLQFKEIIDESVAIN